MNNTIIKGKNILRGRFFKNNRVSYMFILPAFLFYTIFVVIPVFLSFPLSVTNWNGLNPTFDYIGFRNFNELFNSERFYNALGNTFLVTVIVAIASNVIALGLALLVDKLNLLKGLFRSVFYIPCLISGIVAGFIWRVLYNYNFGVINNLLESLNLGAYKLDWIGLPEIAIYFITIPIIWQTVGFYMVIYLAALQSIPKDLLDAAKIDGANMYQKFFKITYPLIAGAVTICLTLALINGLRIFQQIIVMTNGGPGFSTETITYIIYAVAFKEGRMGIGTALAIILFIIIIIAAVIQINFLRKREVQL